MRAMKFGVGQPVRRVEDVRLVSGQGNYATDYAPEGALHAAFLRSPHAHAKFAVTDVEAARALPGVRGIFVAKRLRGARRDSLPRQDAEFGPVDDARETIPGDGERGDPPRRRHRRDGCRRHAMAGARRRRGVRRRLGRAAGRRRHGGRHSDWRGSGLRRARPAMSFTTGIPATRRGPTRSSRRPRTSCG